jgi:hypothetical protein
MQLGPTMMRFAVLTALIAVTLASAQTPRSAGCTNATGSAGLFANTTSPCAQQTACETSYNTCIGTSNVANCTLAALCIGARITCLNAAAANTTGCVGLNGVHVSLLKVAAGDQLFNESDAYKSCAATACRWLNSTFSGAGTNCTLSFDTLCSSPVVAVATLLFRGNFTAILADPVKRQAFADAIGRDLSRALRVLVRIRRMFIAGTRRQAQQTLVVEVEAPGVSANNAAFKTAFAAVAANPSAFLTEASASYTALTGETLTVLKIGTGSSSAAFSSIPVPTTARPATTTTTTTSQAPPPTPATTRAPTVAPGTSTSSGSLARSLAAAAVVAVISALLF